MYFKYKIQEIRDHIAVVLVITQALCPKQKLANTDTDIEYRTDIKNQRKYQIPIPTPNTDTDPALVKTHTQTMHSVQINLIL